MKKTIYTVCTGKFNSYIKSPPNFKDWDCFLFSDDPNVDGKGWIVKPILPIQNVSKRQLSRHPKMNPHLYLKDYDVSAYIDSKLINIKNIDITLNLIHHKWISIQHPHRTSFFQEMMKCLKSNIISKNDAETILKQYKKHHYKENNNLSENCFILRLHNDPNVTKVGEMWWEEYTKTNNERDQLILPLILFKTKTPIFLLKNDFFQKSRK